MYALKGYFNGKEFILDGKATIKANQKVIITVLDEYRNLNEKEEKAFKRFVGRLNSECMFEVNEALKETEKVDVNEW